MPIYFWNLSLWGKDQTKNRKPEMAQWFNQAGPMCQAKEGTAGEVSTVPQVNTDASDVTWGPDAHRMMETHQDPEWALQFSSMRDGCGSIKATQHPRLARDPPTQFPSIWLLTVTVSVGKKKTKRGLFASLKDKARAKLLENTETITRWIFKKIFFIYF